MQKDTTLNVALQKVDQLWNESGNIVNLHLLRVRTVAFTYSNVGE